MNRRLRKSGLWTGALALTLALSACTSSGGKEKSAISKLDRKDKGTLKVAYFNEQAFFMQYGNAFQTMFPNVELEVVSTESVFNAEDPVAEMEKLVKEQQPDALYLTEDQYAKLAGKGMLYDLDAVVKQDEFDLDGFQPSVIELLKAKGSGKLFGLSPSFSTQALYYNKDLFDKYGIPYPTDGMSWEDAMRLAARFPAKKDGDDALNGLFQSSQTSNPFELVRTIGEAKGLTYADADAGTVSIDSPEWKSIFQAVIDGYKSGSISMPSDNGGAGGGVFRSMGGGKMAISITPDSMRFMSGQAAMTIDGPMIMNLMGMETKIGAAGAVRSSKSTDSTTVKPMGSPFKKFEWDVVTVPVDPSQPDVTGNMSLDSVFSINAASENLSAAWEFLKYANGEQLAKTSAKSSPSLSARTAYKTQESGKNIDAFYALKANSQAILQTLPEGFAADFSQLAAEQIKQVVAGSATLDQALKEIQTKGQLLLTKANTSVGQS
ncbi:extracellular solute-binding protein [Cohnella endophytica]|uniref:Extracellular solute-binding protein n=1 Tax=Cohnella endophytica TaxID=2419778 RepID=A0A494Y2N1_9BACL|nr:extracellular solute-binding protein [Cohnella endophytica]RKP56964.1 extracellular solute-binding protein [Cohnella endophytica]